MATPTDDKNEIFSKDNFLSYLENEIEERKKSVRSFNRKRLADRANISKSLLSLILSGQRKVSLNAAEGLSKALALRGKKRRYFLTLARLHNARTDEEKWNIQNELIKIKEGVGEDQLEIRQYRLISLWYYSAVYVLLGLKNISQRPEALLARLGRGLRLEQIEQAFRDLKEMGLIEQKEGRWLQTKSAVTTGSSNKDAALYQYHHQMLKLAMMSLKLPPARRELQGLTVAIPQDKLKVVKSKINDFISDLNSYLSEFNEAEQVYQLNMQLFELSSLVEEGDS